jgi:hypothetical protein
MKKVFKSVFFILLVVLLTSCADEKTINNVTYEPYGFLNEEIVKNDSVMYQVSPWAVFSGIVFCETIVVPVYIVGWELFEPVKLKEKK